MRNEIINLICSVVNITWFILTELVTPTYQLLRIVLSKNITGNRSSIDYFNEGNMFEDIKHKVKYSVSTRFISSFLFISSLLVIFGNLWAIL